MSDIDFLAYKCEHHEAHVDFWGKTQISSQILGIFWPKAGAQVVFLSFKSQNTFHLLGRKMDALYCGHDACRMVARQIDSLAREFRKILIHGSGDKYFENTNIDFFFFRISRVGKPASVIPNVRIFLFYKLI